MTCWYILCTFVLYSYLSKNSWANIFATIEGTQKWNFQLMIKQQADPQPLRRQKSKNRTTMKQLRKEICKSWETGKSAWVQFLARRIANWLRRRFLPEEILYNRRQNRAPKFWIFVLTLGIMSMYVILIYVIIPMYSIDGLHLTSWRACWRYNIKEYVNSIVGSSRRGWLTLSATSPEIGSKLRILITSVTIL